MRKAIVLLSGGLDSAVTLYFAKKQNYACRCLIFDYGQRHKREIESAKKIAGAADCPYRILRTRFPWKGSSLLDKSRRICLKAKQPVGKTANIPATYVPGRNIIFLSFALSFAEKIGAEAIFIGANAVDFSGYPDCRPEFYRAFSRVIATGTKAGVKGEEIKIKTPLIRRTKAQIIRLGVQLAVPFELTWSCYRGGSRPCGNCDSCYFRAKGFAEAGIPDPLVK
ncbi:MAG: 7-cyano-7-deazaguanine synthase QueC [Candidatus Omnitrophota bacterium]